MLKRNDKKRRGIFKINEDFRGDREMAAAKREQLMKHINAGSANKENKPVDGDDKEMKEDTKDIKAKHPGILKVPSTKSFSELPLSHYITLARKKGKAAVMRGLTNLERWNKNKQPSIAKKARSIIDSLKGNKEWEGIGECVGSVKENQTMIKETGEMSMRDIQPGGEDYEWARAIKLDVLAIQDKTKGKLKFKSMEPFDKYVGPYALVNIGGSEFKIFGGEDVDHLNVVDHYNKEAYTGSVDEIAGEINSKLNLETNSEKTMNEKTNREYYNAEPLFCTKCGERVAWGSMPYKGEALYCNDCAEEETDEEETDTETTEESVTEAEKKEAKKEIPNYTEDPAVLKSLKDGVKENKKDTAEKWVVDLFRNKLGRVVAGTQLDVHLAGNAYFDEKTLKAAFEKLVKANKIEQYKDAMGGTLYRYIGKEPEGEYNVGALKTKNVTKESKMESTFRNHLIEMLQEKKAKKDDDETKDKKDKSDDDKKEEKEKDKKEKKDDDDKKDSKSDEKSDTDKKDKPDGDAKDKDDKEKSDEKKDGDKEIKSINIKTPDEVGDSIKRDFADEISDMGLDDGGDDEEEYDVTGLETDDFWKEPEEIKTIAPESPEMDDMKPAVSDIVNEPASMSLNYICPVCGHEMQGDVTVEVNDVPCPECMALMHKKEEPVIDEPDVEIKPEIKSEAMPEITNVKKEGEGENSMLGGAEEVQEKKENK